MISSLRIINRSFICIICYTVDACYMPCLVTIITISIASTNVFEVRNILFASKLNSPLQFVVRQTVAILVRIHPNSYHRYSLHISILRSSCVMFAHASRIMLKGRVKSSSIALSWWKINTHASWKYNRKKLSIWIINYYRWSCSYAELPFNKLE